MTVCIVAIAGSSGSGKTHFSTMLAAHYGEEAIIMSADNYYKEGQQLETEKIPNHDDPRALDFNLLAQHLQILKEGGDIDRPCYDFSTHKRVGTERVGSKPYIILEGILVLYAEQLTSLITVGIFIEADKEVCRLRRMERDIKERGRTPENAAWQWENLVLPAYIAYVSPSRHKASIIVQNSVNFSHFGQCLFDITQVLSLIAELTAMPRLLAPVSFDLGFFIKSPPVDSHAITISSAIEVDRRLK